jgi:ribosome-associated heat shock protein Hsp15
MTSGVRVDVWLWSVRLTPSRSVATDLCRSSRVTINGVTAKPASTVKPGDRIEARIAKRDRVVEVVEPIAKRVGAPIAVTCYVDLSPLVVRDESAPAVQRDRGAGRPTKRDRRQIDKLRS